MKYLVILASFLFVFNSTAQFFQTGFTVGTNYTLAIKGRSEYDKRYFKPIGRFGFSMALPLHFKINEIWKVKTGFDYQSKAYKIKFSNPDFPGLESTGGFEFSARFNIIQIPFILSYKKPKQNLEFDMGVLFTRNIPGAIGSGGDWMPQYSGNDTLNYRFQNTYNNDFTPFNSVDIHFGVEYGFVKRGIKKHGIKLSFEFNNFTSTQYAMEASLENSSISQMYKAKISPKLSSLKLSYTNYIEWNKKDKK